LNLILNNIIENQKILKKAHSKNILCIYLGAVGFAVFKEKVSKKNTEKGCFKVAASKFI
jgi:hypothetical protein